MTVCGEDLIATGGSDNVVRIWNWRNQAEADRMLGHTGSVAALAFDPASGVIVSGSFDTTVRVWTRDGRHHPRRFAVPAPGPARRGLKPRAAC